MGVRPADLAAAWLERLPRDETGYAEELDANWKDVGGPARSALAQARLAYVMTHAGILGESRCALAGREAVERLERLFWLPECKGWARCAPRPVVASGTGPAIDRSIDTYDQAFALLALAWHYRATGDAAARERALLGVDGLRASCGASMGYPEARPGESMVDAALHPHRRQNPHMHLLEAALAWDRADPGGPWLDMADEIVELFRMRLFDADTGSVGEHFTADWRPAPGKVGQYREPGHGFEWVWLLRSWQLCHPEDTEALGWARELYRFACASVDHDGLALDAVGRDGEVLRPTKLLWPQTEALKAHVAWHEWTGDRMARLRALSLRDLVLTLYLGSDGVLYHNQLGRDGFPLPVPTLSRVLYHLFVALVEAERVLGIE